MLIQRSETEGRGEFETVTVIEINSPIFTYGYQTDRLMQSFLYTPNKNFVIGNKWKLDDLTRLPMLFKESKAI